MATIMTANVFFIIMPNQRKSIAALQAGQRPDPAWGQSSKIRSTHNNYITLPVLFLMLSNHYPSTFSNPRAIPPSSPASSSLARCALFLQRLASRPRPRAVGLGGAHSPSLRVGFAATASPGMRSLMGLRPCQPQTARLDEPKGAAGSSRYRAAEMHDVPSPSRWKRLASAPKGASR